MEAKIKKALENAFRPTLALSWLISSMIFLYPAAAAYIMVKLAPFNGFWPMGSAAMLLLRVTFGVVSLTVFYFCRYWQKSLMELSNKAIEGEKEMAWVFERFILRSLFIMVLSELSAIFGFILFLLQAAGSDFIFFFLLTVVQLNYFFPRYRNWERIVLYHLNLYVKEKSTQVQMR